MKPRSDTAALLWLGLVLSIALAIAFLLPVTPQDYWWYLRIGRDTLTAGALPQIDTLSYTRAGSPVVYFSWGAAVLFWLIYKLGGLSLTVLVRGLLVALAYSLVWLTARRLGAGRIGAALVLLLAVLASSNNWSIRPQLFAYPLFALALYLLYRWQNGDRKAVWWLPLISLLWVNLHGSFVVLVLLTGAALVFGRGDKRLLALAFAGILLATFLNPRGFGSWTYVFNSLTVASSQQFSVEWRPPVNSGWQMNIFFLWLLAFPLLAVFSPRKLEALEWTWFLGFGFLALWGERYVIWFVFILTVLTSLMLADWEKNVLGDPKQGSPALNLTLSLVFILLPLTLLPGVREAWWPAPRGCCANAPAATENTPVAATKWLAAHPDLRGPLWSEIGFSSYLEFALPERPVWIDTRFEVFPVEQWQQYKDITNATWEWPILLTGTDANLLMISVTEQPALLQAMNNQGLWCEIYRDELAVIYQHCGGE
ncbi:MAG: hypothetical protein IMZ50_16180 [Candidatus Atribacteria bacterium]|nr:hypothetical protein [Candidatus Atribacteria bacterium]